ncbi:unnamed protein product [Rotaria magnacalcarata]|uniref:Globin-sensor domain-containing protein n=1 Tax=Rotaria magnacalcarata TaxID=392030 RepID=A0A816V713_9BILA|nr:unnamed protein product [Rotaria magnacalcarata]CAF1604360.1 unnamed protein product [Rotaria magnacalcarata]CAF2114523.1 unnamed protein product [Rotaria magnacalcarata]CAF2123281.1 unnamed protein product [Rotaria magnacalcarata]CAF2141178.1 unnamed protein product [Rotaria magnacalcarata]
MTEHIDKTLIENNLRNRFDYISKFIKFTTDDIAALNDLGRLAVPLIPIIVDQIFQRVLDFDITKRYFVMRHSGFTGVVPVNESELTLESEQMVFRRTALCKYFKRVLRQKVWNDAFLEYISHVGKIHTKMAGSESVDIDYVHINILFAYVEHILLDVILSNGQIADQRKKSVIIALNKFLWIQNDFFAMHYIRQSKSINFDCCVPKADNGKLSIFCIR